jgi:ATP-dependent Lon protease
MSEKQSSSKVLPPNPNAEYLRKEAKRLARDESLQLAAAQRRLAHGYGYRNWSELMTAVASASTSPQSDTADTSTLSDPPIVRGSGATVFPMLPLRGLVAFPDVSYPIFVGRPTSIRAVRHAQECQVPLILAAQKDLSKVSPSGSDMYQVGTLGDVIQALRLPDGTIKTVIQAKRRVRISNFVFDQDFPKANVEEIAESASSDTRIESLVPSVISALVAQRARTFGKDKPEAWAVPATTADKAAMLADRIASELEMPLSWKQALLELTDPAERLEKVLVCLLNASS